jgi:hypothetical protein
LWVHCSARGEIEHIYSEIVHIYIQYYMYMQNNHLDKKTSFVIISFQQTTDIYRQGCAIIFTETPADLLVKTVLL